MKKKLLIIIILLSFISVCGVYASFNNQNTVNNDYGCCSIVLQLDDNNSIMSFRRDSDTDADIHIEKINWHGKPALKQYKSDGKYFCHVIITDDGWMIGMGGIDDGVNSEKIENITSSMINDNNTISESYLKDIQEIKKPYGRGHVVIKAPDGNCGFATVDMIKTGKLEAGQYISMPNNYSLSRSGNISLDSNDKIKDMVKLSQSDKYGLDRRDITVFQYHIKDNKTVIDAYVSNEDGSKLGENYTGCVDDIYFNGNLIKADEIPIAPDYKIMGSVEFGDDNDTFMAPIIIGVFIIFIVVLFFGILKLVRLIRYS